METFQCQACANFFEAEAQLDQTPERPRRGASGGQVVLGSSAEKDLKADNQTSGDSYLKSMRF